jgi:hypothetical protein
MVTSPASGVCGGTLGDAMPRLPDAIRSEIINKVAGAVADVLDPAGFLVPLRCTDAAAKLELSLAKIARKHRDVHIVGESRDGVPGLSWFFWPGYSLLSWVGRNPASSSALADKSSASDLRGKLEKLRQYTCAQLEEKFGSEAPDIAGMLGFPELFTPDNIVALSPRKQQSPGAVKARPALPPKQLAAEIVSEFESYPRLFDFLVPTGLPRTVFHPLFEDRYVMSDSIRLEIMSAEDRLRLQSDAVSDHSYTLRIAIPGFELIDGEDQFGRMASVTKQFLGLMVGGDILNVIHAADRYSRDQIETLCIRIGAVTAAEYASTGWTLPVKALDFAEGDEFSSDDCLLIHSLALSDPNRSPYWDDSGRFVPSSLWDAKLPRLRSVVSGIAYAFRSDDRRLLAAAEWFLDSFSGTNEALQLVQVITTFEILLGAESKGDKTLLLSNRCAYLLGGGAAEREEIERTFKHLYDVRSRILHAGERRLPERSTLPTGRRLLQRVIQRELRFLVPQE